MCERERRRERERETERAERENEQPKTKRNYFQHGWGLLELVSLMAAAGSRTRASRGEVQTCVRRSSGCNVAYPKNAPSLKSKIYTLIKDPPGSLVPGASADLTATSLFTVVWPRKAVRSNAEAFFFFEVLGA